MTRSEIAIQIVDLIEEKDQLQTELFGVYNKKIKQARIRQINKELKQLRSDYRMYLFTEVTEQWNKKR